jgi:hypothetical protein
MPTTATATMNGYTVYAPKGRPLELVKNANAVKSGTEILVLPTPAATALTETIRHGATFAAKACTRFGWKFLSAAFSKIAASSLLGPLVACAVVVAIVVTAAALSR